MLHIVDFELPVLINAFILDAVCIYTVTIVLRGILWLKFTIPPTHASIKQYQPDYWEKKEQMFENTERTNKQTLNHSTQTNWRLASVHIRD